MPEDKSVQFNEPTVLRQQGLRKSGVTKLIIKLGLAKDEKQAGVVLIVVGVLAIIVMVVFWPRSSNQPAPPPAADVSSVNTF